MTDWSKSAVVALLDAGRPFCWIATRELATISALALA